MKKNILITGGTGFIGSSITKLLAEDVNNKIRVFDNNSRGSLEKLGDTIKNIKFIKGDICDYKKVLKASKNCKIVIHLAYINGTEYFYKYPTKILEVAIKGLMNVVEACIKNKITELYLASSSEVYHQPSSIPTKEDVILKIPDIYNPRYSYAGGKILTELVGINYGKKFFKKLIIFRPHNVYGPNMGNEHVIPQFINRMSKLNKKKIFFIKGTGKEIRSFIYIDDFAQAFYKIFKKGKHLEIYNIGTERKINILQLSKKISKIMKKNIVISKRKLAAGGTLIRCPDISKIKKLGFVPKFSLEEGLSKTIKNYLNK